jgi:2-oxoglutarate ferredoxin oxidoreductase subunit alpha
MSDTYLADSEWTFQGFNTTKIQYNDYRVRGETLQDLSEYKRHVFTESGVSPLAVPGASKHLVVTDSDEHDEEGHLIEDAETRIKMTDKRLLKKMPLIKEEIAPPFFYGNDRPETVLVGWGSTYGVIREAVDELSEQHNIAMLHFSEVFPFPSTNEFDFMNILQNAKLTICIENNATGQFARHVRAETGFEFDEKIHKYHGRPFIIELLASEILRRQYDQK